MINVGKTLVISFHTKHNGFPIVCKITYSNMDIAYKLESKFLGIQPLRHSLKEFKRQLTNEYIQLEFLLTYQKLMMYYIMNYYWKNYLIMV
jgi:hypothetical protein